MKIIDAPIFTDTAACVTSDLPADAWFPVGPEEWVRSLQALAACRSCLAREACAQWAIERPGLEGIWGGLTEKQRRQLYRRGRAS